MCRHTTPGTICGLPPTAYTARHKTKSRFRLHLCAATEADVRTGLSLGETPNAIAARCGITFKKGKLGMLLGLKFVEKVRFLERQMAKFERARREEIARRGPTPGLLTAQVNRMAVGYDGRGVQPQLAPAPAPGGENMVPDIQRVHYQPAVVERQDQLVFRAHQPAMPERAHEFLPYQPLQYRQAPVERIEVRPFYDDLDMDDLTNQLGTSLGF